MQPARRTSLASSPSRLPTSSLPAERTAIPRRDGRPARGRRGRRTPGGVTRLVEPTAAARADLRRVDQRPAVHRGPAVDRRRAAVPTRRPTEGRRGVRDPLRDRDRRLGRGRGRDRRVPGGGGWEAPRPADREARTPEPAVPPPGRGPTPARRRRHPVRPARESATRRRSDRPRTTVWMARSSLTGGAGAGTARRAAPTGR